jgi:hypothetical protein
MGAVQTPLSGSSESEAAHAVEADLASEPAATLLPRMSAPEIAAVALSGAHSEAKSPLYLKLLPWLWLITGIASAFTMDRGPAAAAGVAVAALASWLCLLLLHWLARLKPEAVRSRWRRRVLFALRHSSLMATQNAIQLGLFFALPFYWQAATREIGHGLFMAALGLLSAATLWDPFTEWLLLRPVLGPLLLASSSFVGLNAVLPGLGLSTQRSLWAAAFTAALGVLILATSNVPSAERKRVALWTFVPSLLLPLALQLGAARIVPAAPLRLSKIQIGTQISGKWISAPLKHLDTAPPHLFCATAIASPVGVRDRLFHVWSYNGIRRAQIELDIRGGRAAGYRTRSRFEVSSGYALGRYSCQVETASGQVLGRESITIGRPPIRPHSTPKS